MRRLRARRRRRDFGRRFRAYQLRRATPRPGAPRILHAVANLWTGGSARLVVDLIEHLGEEFEHRVVTRSVPDVQGYQGIDVALLDEDFGSAFADHLREARPDLVHVHYLGHRRTAWSRTDLDWYSALFDALAASDRPVVENVNIPVEPFVHPSVRRYVYVSEFVRRTFDPGTGKSVVVYPGSDLDFFRPADAPVPDDTVGMVYRLESDKLDERAIEPFIHVLRQSRHAKALIVGGGRFYDAYRAAVRRAGVTSRTTFTGYVSYADLPRLYARMSVFVAPVHTESFGQVTPFAMGTALPVAGYAVGALEEILGSDELLVPHGDAEGLAAVLLALLEDRGRRLEMGARNRSRAEQLFGIEAMVAAYARLYSETLAGP